MNTHICKAHDCDNTIKGRRNDALYCSNYCRERAKRHRKLNGTHSTSSVGSARAMPITGNIVNDISANAASALLSPNISNPMAAMGNNALMTCIPHAFQAIKNKPFLSLFLGIGGYWLGGKFFNNCTTTVTIEDGKESKSESCQKATGLQKSGSAAIGVIAGSFLLDAIQPILNGSSTIGNTQGDTLGKPDVNPSYNEGRIVRMSGT